MFLALGIFTTEGENNNSSSSSSSSNNNNNNNNNITGINVELFQKVGNESH